MAMKSRYAAAAARRGDVLSPEYSDGSGDRWG